MSEDFILMAQALDNASPNHFEVEGREVLVQEIDHRQRIVSQVSEVTKEGIKILDTSGISMTVDKQYYVIEVTTVQRDIAGRLAPVLCYGSYDKRDLTQLGDVVLHKVEGFARSIGRELEPGSSDLVREAFLMLKKKSVHDRRLTFVGTLVVLLLSLALLRWLLP